MSAWWEVINLIFAWGGFIVVTFFFASMGWHIGKSIFK